MLNAKFGIEVEFTGISRAKAARIVKEHFGGELKKEGGYYDKYVIKNADGRKWTLMSDGSIRGEIKKNGQVETTYQRIYQVELVSPILKYENDIESLQELIRKLRKAGARTNSSTGIHIHLDGSNHTAKSVKNFINIIASKNDLLYKMNLSKLLYTNYSRK